MDIEQNKKRKIGTTKIYGNFVENATELDKSLTKLLVRVEGLIGYFSPP